MSSAAVPLIPRRVLFGNPEKIYAQVSPDGEMISYLAPHEGVLNVWIRTASTEDDRVITSERAHGIKMYWWQTDGKHILYTQDVDGNEDHHIFQVEIATCKTHDLTPGDGIRAILIAQDYEHNFALIGLNRRARELFDVHRLDYRSGQIDLDTENPGDVAGWSPDNDFQILSCTAYLSDGSQEIRLRKGSSSPWVTFLKFGPEETFGGIVGFAPGNKSVYLISSVDANAARLVEVSIDTNSTKVIAESPHHDVAEVIIHPRTHLVEAAAFVRDKMSWQFLDTDLQADFEVLRQVQDGEVSPLSRDASDTKWIVSVASDDQPSTTYLYDRRARTAQFLFASRPALKDHHLSKMCPIWYSARDGLTIHGYLTMPVGVEMNAPTVMLVHGGPWSRDMWGYHAPVQWLANRGYAVLQTNFRGSTGYGKKFLNAGNREWAAKMHQDLLDAKEWAIRNGYSDPSRFAIMGGSYGGYATLVALAFTPDAFTCGIDIVGPSNLITLLKTIPPYWAPLKSMFDKRVGNIETEAEFLRSRSPLFKAEQIRAPLLIGQGKNDPRVLPAESDQIVEAMRRNGQKVEYIFFPDEGHGFSRPENNLRFFAAAERFLADHLAGRCEPPSRDEDWIGFLR